VIFERVEVIFDMDRSLFGNLVPKNGLGFDGTGSAALGFGDALAAEGPDPLAGEALYKQHKNSVF